MPRATAAAEQQQTSSEHCIEEIEEATATDAAKERASPTSRAELGLT